MEFDNIFTAIQGRLHSTQKKLNSKLVDILNYGDDLGVEAVSLIENAIKELNLSEENQRRVHLLFLLNTSFYSCTFVEKDRNYCHIIGSIPKISVYIYFKLTAQMDWHPFMGECILFCPEVLTADILKQVDIYLKTLDSNKAIPFVQCLYENHFKKITVTDCKKRRQKIVKYFLKTINFDFEEIVGKMECSEELKDHYWGYVIRMYLELTEFCIRFMESPSVSAPDIYNFNIEYDYTTWPCRNDEPNWVEHCLGLIATNTALIVRKVSVSMYMSWCEVDLPGFATEKTLQKSVREAAYTCREAVKSISNLHDNVAGLRLLETSLENMALRPVTEDEEVAAADPNTLLMNILNPKRTQVKWLRGLIDRGIFESAPYMKVVTDNAMLMDLETCYFLLTKAIPYISSNDVFQNDLVLIRETVFKCIKALSVSDQIQLLEKFFSQYGLNTCLCSDNFETVITSLLNKIVLDSNRNQEEYTSDLICLAIENSKGVISFSFRECLTSKQKSDLIISMLESIKPIFFFNYDGEQLGLSQISALVLTLTQTRVEQHKENFIYTVKSLCNKSLIDTNKLLNNTVIPAFESSVVNKDWPSIIYLLNLTEVLSEIENSKQLSLVTLIAKTLCRLRPKVTAFCTDAIFFTSSCASFLNKLITRFVKDRDEEDGEVKWLRGISSCLSPLTYIYMTELWTKWDKEPPLNNDDPYVYWALYGLGRGTAINTIDHKQRFAIVSAIVKVIPQLTMNEWEKIGTDKIVATDANEVVDTFVSVFFVLADCVLILFQLPFMIEDPACLGHVLTNFLHYTKVNILKIMKDINEERRSSIQDKISQIVQQLPQQLAKSKIPLLIHLQKTMSEYTESAVKVEC